MALKLYCCFPLKLGHFLFGCFYHRHCVPRTAKFQRGDTHVTSEKMLQRETLHPQGFYLLCAAPPMGISTSHLLLGLHLLHPYHLIRKS